MYQRGGLQRVTRRFISHFRGRELAQLLINQRQKFIGGLRVALLDRFDHPGDVAHGPELSVSLPDAPVRPLGLAVEPSTTETTGAHFRRAACARFVCWATNDEPLRWFARPDTRCRCRPNRCNRSHKGACADAASESHE